MKRTLKKVLSLVLSVILVFGIGVSAFAEDVNTPVIVVNDLDKNPIIDTETGETAFSFADYRKTILFTTGFPSEFYDNLTIDDVRQKVKDMLQGNLSAKDILSLVMQATGFSDDITGLVSKVMELVAGMGIDISKLDIKAILNSIDVQALVNTYLSEIEAKYENFNKVALNEDGTSKDGKYSIEDLGNGCFSDIDTDVYGSEIAYSIAEQIGYENVYVFNYDFRLDPVENAAEFDEYVSRIKEASGSDKVNIVSEGYGSVIAVTYLSEHKDDAVKSVRNFVTVSSAFEGTSFVGDIYSGNIENRTNVTNEYTSAVIRYLDDLSDNPLTAAANWITNYSLNSAITTHRKELNEKLDGIKKLNYAAFKAEGCLKTMTTMPGLWALVPVDMYTDAVNNIYGENPDKSVTEKLDNFKSIQENISSVLEEVTESGMNVGVVAMWDLQEIPIGNTVSEQSDSVIDTKYQSFGATCIDLNEVGEAYKAVQADDLDHDHLSDSYDSLDITQFTGAICHYIDASTCALPENTWFIKNMKHGSFSSDSNSVNLIKYLALAEDSKTVDVWQQAAFAQFLDYNRFVSPGELHVGKLQYSGDGKEVSILKGDVDLDGKITSNDSYLIYSYLSGDTELDKNGQAYKNADANGDGEINKADAEYVLSVSNGTSKGHTAGIDTEYKTDAGTLDASDFSLELRPEFDPVNRSLTVNAYLVGASGAQSGNFILTYNKADLKLYSVTPGKFDEGKTIADSVSDKDNTIAFSFAKGSPLKSSDLDDNGDFLLGTAVFTISNTIDSTDLNLGEAHFFSGGTEQFISPCNLHLDRSFFYILGDWDDNTYITAYDARGILRIAANLEKPTDDAMFKRCDVDEDGKITALDARQVLRMSAKLITEYTKSSSKEVTSEVSTDTTD